ncbi:hypothetical protein [Shinella sp.]|uniref:hypothetical protein n=1 Tax=Shinella sp. TaxID=1870904 RepID=UPI00289690EB|nr:hypothetical protein [Shinella sp.]
MPNREMIIETVADSDLIGPCTTLVDLIADLQAALEKVPEEFRGSAVLNIEAYDWTGSQITYERPITDEELAARAEAVERQRQNAAKYEKTRLFDEWVRNVRLNTDIKDRDEAIAFIKSDSESCKFHPDSYRGGWAT